MKKNIKRYLKIFNIKYLILFFLFLFFLGLASSAQAYSCKCTTPTFSGGKSECKNISFPNCSQFESSGSGGQFGTGSGTSCKLFASDNCTVKVGEACLENIDCETGVCSDLKCVAVKTKEKVPWQPIAPKLQINIPTWTPFTSEDIEKLKQTDEEGNVYIPFIGLYIAAVYRWAVGIAAIVAVVFVIWGGFLYLTSGGNAQRAQEGKDRISHALFGLLLLLGSYALLYTINPDLVRFKSLKVKVIERMELDIVKSGSDNGQSSEGVSASCLQSTEMSQIPTSISKSGDRSIHKDLMEPLKKVEELAEAQGKSLYITPQGGFRTLTEQQIKWDEALKEYGTEEKARKFVAKPSCSAPHLTGRALDICFKGSPTCKKISSKFADLDDPDVKLLQNIMKEAGFKRYCNEWWHFEYNLAAPNRCSP